MANSTTFARRQRDNYFFAGSKNDDFKKASGNEIVAAIRQFVTSDKTSDLYRDFYTMLEFIDKETETDNGSGTIASARDFFKKHRKLLESISVDEMSLFNKFFIETSTDDLEKQSAYDIVELLKCITGIFTKIRSDDDGSISRLSQKSRDAVYKRAEGYSNTYRGDEYQKLIGMLYAWRAFADTEKAFSIYSEKARVTEEDWDFGKFDDIIFKADNFIEVVQVKHAGSTISGNRVYSIDHLAGKGEKKAGLYLYYDSWAKLKEQAEKKGEDIRFVFYSNHGVDKGLEHFYNPDTQRLSGLLKEHNGQAAKDQAELINSIYANSSYFRNMTAKRFVERGELYFSIEMDGLNWQVLIDENIDNIFKLFNSDRKRFTKKYADQDDSFEKLNYLLLGSFGKDAVDEESRTLTISQRFFEEDLASTRPIHEYFRNALLEKAQAESIDVQDWYGKELKLNKDFAELNFIKKTNKSTRRRKSNKTRQSLADLSISFIDNRVDLSLEDNDGDNDFYWFLLLGFGVVDKQVRYNPELFDLNDSLVKILHDSSRLPYVRFSKVSDIDPTIKEFLSNYSFSIKNPGIDDLERELEKEIGKYFGISSRIFYHEFQEYFLKNFRSPIGEVVNRNKISQVFDKAQKEASRLRLVGRVEKYRDRFKDKKDVVDPDKLIELDREFNRIDQHIVVVTGEKYVGKSFTISRWIDGLEQRGWIKSDNYAFISLEDLMSSDIDLLKEELELIIVDDVDEKSLKRHKELVIKLADTAANFDKKVVIVTDDPSFEELGMVLSGNKYATIECEPLSGDQVLGLLDIDKEDKFFRFGNISYIGINELLSARLSYGLGRVMHNPGHLDRISKYIVDQVSDYLGQRKKEEIYIEPTVSIANSLNIDNLKSIDRLLIYGSEQSIDLDSYFSKAIVLSPKELIAKGNPKESVTLIVRIENKDLSKEVLSKIKRLRNLVVLTSSAEVFSEFFPYIDDVFYSPNAKGDFKIIKTSIARKKWHGEKVIDWRSHILTKEPIAKKVLVVSDAGMGKSTSVKQLAKLREVKDGEYFWVLPIYLDQIRMQDNRQWNFIDFLLMQVLKRIDNGDNIDVRSKLLLREILVHDLAQGNILLLLDGLDQVSKDAWIRYEDIYRDLLGYSHVVLFSRPNAPQLLDFSANTRLDLDVFSDVQVAEYFYKAFPKPKDNPFHKRALEFIENHQDLKEMLGIPLQCYLFWQAWLPHYEDWCENRSADIPVIDGDERSGLISLYRQFIDSRFIIHFQRNFGVSKEGLLRDRSRVDLLSQGYIEHLTKMAARNQFAGFQVVNLLEDSIPQDWLDMDIQSTALIKRAVINPDEYRYIFPHRTYQEYFAAKFFVDGFLGNCRRNSKQYEWCREILETSRFSMGHYKFWQFVLALVKSDLEGVAEDRFEEAFKDHPDLIGGLQDYYWDFLMANKKKPPRSLSVIEKTSSEDRSLSDTGAPTFDDFKDVEQIISEYSGSLFVRHDSDLYHAVGDLAKYQEIEFGIRYKLLMYAKRPGGDLHYSYRLHEAIAEALGMLWKEAQTLNLEEYDRALVKEIVDYLDPDNTSILSYEPKEAASNALERGEINEYNKEEFVQLISYDLKDMNIEPRFFGRILLMLEKMDVLLDEEVLRRIIDKFKLEILDEDISLRSVAIELFGGIYKNNLREEVKFLTTAGIDVYDPMHFWLKLEGVEQVPTSSNIVDHMRFLDDQSMVATRRVAFYEIDGGIPATCIMRDSFNTPMAAYLINVMSKDYWQYPLVLSSNIPYLLDHQSENDFYPALALRVYGKYLDRLSRQGEDDSYRSNHISNFIDHVVVNARKALEYAWEYATRSSSAAYEEGFKVVTKLGTFLSWPLFISSSYDFAFSMVIPSAGSTLLFKGSDNDKKARFDKAIKYFIP